MTRFASIARAAIEKHVPESRGPRAHWVERPNLSWVRWPRAAGGYSYVGLRRHLGWVTGEAAIAAEPVELDRLTLGALEAHTAAPSHATAGHRVRLGDLLGEEDRWWPAGATPAETTRQLEWIVLQIRVKAETYFARHPHSGAAIER